MNPLVRLRLAHPQHAPMDRLRRRLFPIDHNEQEAIFRRGEWAVLRGRISPNLSATAGQGPVGHRA